jgi:N-acylglucosamine-6-phosphate 2-epimerase
VKRDPCDVIDALAGKLIVSCQDYTAVMIDAAVRGGAAGLRINGPHDVRLARRKTDLPVVACNKMYFPNSPVYITPSIRAAVRLVEAGAQIVALDCTRRPRVRQQPSEIIAAIHGAGAVALADLSCIDEAEDAIQAGADILATTLAATFDLEFIRQLISLGKPVLAEGHVDTPERAAQARDAGVWAVCVGSAITRPHLLTAQFNRALGE